MSPLNAPLDYDYGRPGSSPVATTQDQWADSNGQWTDGNDQRGRALDIYPLGYTQQHMGSSYPSMYDQPLSPSDPAYYQTMTTTPPTSSFAASGLPFRGLDYIRNYNSDTVPNYMQSGIHDSWQTFDPSAFGYDPDIPFQFPVDGHGN